MKITPKTKPRQRSSSSRQDTDVSPLNPDNPAKQGKEAAILFVDASRMVSLGKHLRSIRQSRGLTQEKLASLSAGGISSDIIGKVENGDITTRRVRHYIDALNKEVGSNGRPKTPPLSDIELTDEFLNPNSVRQGSFGPAAVVAYKVWWELTTRKVALELDTENDVIAQVYDSWYICFGKVRDYALELPVGFKAERVNLLTISKICDRVLNHAMRPHLTQWQARFRHWLLLQSNKPSGSKLRPQDHERKFPQYKELITDLVRANHELAKLREELQTFVFGPQQQQNE